MPSKTTDLEVDDSPNSDLLFVKAHARRQADALPVENGTYRVAELRYINEEN